MKKIFLSVLFSVIGIITLCISKNNGIRAYAVNDFTFYVEEVTSDTPLEDNAPVLIGDYKISVAISNNSGFDAIAMRFPYNSNKLTVIQDSNRPYFEYGAAGATLVIETDDNNQFADDMGIVSFSGMRINPTTHNGIILSVFVRKNPVTFSSNDSIEDNIYQPELVVFQESSNFTPDYHPYISLSYNLDDTFMYQESVEYSYILGDVNGDGDVSLDDAQIINNMISAFQNAYPNAEFTTDANVGTLFPNSGNYVGLYVEINNNDVLLLKVADVNYDNVIDSTDALLVLNYYTKIMGGLTPNSNIGTEMTDVIYIVQFATL